MCYHDHGVAGSQAASCASNTHISTVNQTSTPSHERKAPPITSFFPDNQTRDRYATLPPGSRMSYPLTLADLAACSASQAASSVPPCTALANRTSSPLMVASSWNSPDSGCMMAPPPTEW